MAGRFTELRLFKGDYIIKYRLKTLLSLCDLSLYDYHFI